MKEKKMTFKNKLVFALLLILLSCNNSNHDIDKSPEYIDKIFLKKLSHYSPSIPSYYTFNCLFITFDNNGKGIVNVDILYEIYKKKYFKTYQSFEVFLSDALNQKIKFINWDFSKLEVIYFSLHNDITKNYDSVFFPDFIEKFCDKKQNGFTVKKEYSNKENLYSILYYCFINNYKVTFDDYIGRYYLIKQE